MTSKNLIMPINQMDTNQIVLFNKLKQKQGNILVERFDIWKVFNKIKCSGDWQSYTEELASYNEAIRKVKRSEVL